MGRILALDIGESRIGLAITDESQTIAQPLETTCSPSEITGLIDSLSQDYEISKIVVGWPKSLSGEAGKQSESVKKVGDRISTFSNIPIEYLDERYTTQAAIRMPDRDPKIPIDSLAAQILLENYLTKNKNQNIDESVSTRHNN